MHVLIIDNYDSFTYNLAQAFAASGCRVSVHRNDALSVEELVALEPDRVVISPGPGGPRGSGISADALAEFRGRVPVLGVCLGHQVLAASFGAVVEPAQRPTHGKRSGVLHDGRGIFSGLPSPFDAARYHSLVVRESSLPGEIRVCARTEEGEVMALQVEGEETWGVQFHPESYMTEWGAQLLANFCPPPSARAGAIEGVPLG